MALLRPLRVTGVSIHAPARGATTFSAIASVSSGVSIHAPARGATHPCGGHLRRSCGFNPRPREGGDEIPPPCTPCSLGFQSTPPRGGRRSPDAQTLIGSGFQSTPPRGGRPNTPFELQGILDVSIHAPARGATSKERSRLNQLPFQSTPPRGGRLGKRMSGREVSVSIHAPARGATQGPQKSGCRGRCFNPRPREGGDAQGAWIPETPFRFNPRPREGGDRAPTCTP